MDQFGLMVVTPAEPPNGDYKYVDLPEFQGRQLLAKYPNGYGASVVQHKFSYGGKEGKFELAVTHPEKLCYATPVTNDVIGWLGEVDVVTTLHKIAQLPKNDYCNHTEIRSIINELSSLVSEDD